MIRPLLQFVKEEFGENPFSYARVMVRSKSRPEQIEWAERFQDLKEKGVFEVFEVKPLAVFYTVKGV